MAEASEGSIDLASLLRANKVEALHTTALCGPVKFLVWTRLSEEGSFWIINASDGVDVWHLQLDKTQLDSHRELAEVDGYDTYFARFRSEFESGSISVAQIANKIAITVGTGIPSLCYDLYEAKASERKTELRTILFRLADRVSQLTEQLKVSSDSLERLKNQKDGAAAGSSVFDIPPKKTSQAPPVKRKQGHSLINPGSRKEAEVDGSNTEHNVHISVLANDQTLDIYKCTDPSCEHFCTKTNKRYHCPLCNNKPQKPGRMRRHFEKMHSSKQIVQHGGYQMLRCKLRCMKANGRVTDNSHYHCCLCGRVLVRKVHLYCHLQAHSVGSVQEIDEIMDAKDDAEEGPLEDNEMDEDDEHDTTLDASQISGLDGSQQDGVVALPDGTQVVFVQSIQGSETLTVVPLDEQTSSLQLSQQPGDPQGSPVVSTAADLSSGLQAMTSVSSSLDPSIQQQLPQELTVKQVEAMLNQGRENAQSASIEAGTSHSNLQNLNDEEDRALQAAYEPQQPTDIEMGHDMDSAQRRVSKQEQDETMDYEPCLQVTDIQMSATGMSDTNAPDIASGEQSALPLPQVTGTSGVLTSQAAELSSTTTASVLATSTHTSESLQVVADQDSSKLVMINPLGKPLLDEAQSSLVNAAQKTPKSTRQDSLLLYDAATAPKDDDHIFKVLLNNLSPATSCFNHPSVLNERNNLDIRRCRNTFCDCRLYHCPLCTCLPNKPGRIREHFKKIHAQDLVVRYQGYQMLRCKLGCTRPSGTKVSNSHYHCCLCGVICMRKSGVYEHMRINHSIQPVKRESLSQLSQQQKEAKYDNPVVPKPVIVQVPSVQSGAVGSGTQQSALPNLHTVQTEPTESGTNQQVVLPSIQTGSVELGNQQVVLSSSQSETLDSGSQQVVQPLAPSSQGVVTTSSSPQTVTVQLPQQGYGNAQGQQQLVIVMPQQMNQTQVQSPVQAQQPIVIVMPQTGGAQVTQPIVVPVPQATSN